MHDDFLRKEVLLVELSDEVNISEQLFFELELLFGVREFLYLFTKSEYFSELLLTVEQDGRSEATELNIALDRVKTFHL
jgi:hypothetical protein